jgi:two-component system, LuxR family, response regulator FixJ
MSTSAIDGSGRSRRLTNGSSRLSKAGEAVWNLAGERKRAPEKASVDCKGLSLMNGQLVYLVFDDPQVEPMVTTLATAMGLRVSASASAEDFLARYDRQQAGCLVLGLRLPGMSGLDLLDLLPRQAIHLPTIVLSAFADIPSTVKAMQAGALTVLEKWPLTQELSDALRQALTLDAEHRAKEQRLAQFKTLLLSLTVEEHQVLEGVLAGKPNKTIARMLGISLRTVESRRQTVQQKLQVTSLAALVRLISEYEELSDSPLFPVISGPDSHPSHGEE